MEYMSPDVIAALDEMLRVADRLSGERRWAERRGTADGRPFTFLIAMGEGAHAIDEVLKRSSFVDPRSTEQSRERPDADGASR